MAITQTNRILTGLSGSIGNLVFRNLPSKPVAPAKRAASKTQLSEQQQENCFKFKCASSYAKNALLEPTKNAYYKHKAAELNLPNAYTAAIVDYMRKAEVTGLDIRSYRGRAGDVIRMKIEKKDFAVQEVKAALYTTEGKLIESNSAVKTGEQVFEYRAKTNVPYYMTVILRITVCDHIMNMTTKDIRITR